MVIEIKIPEIERVIPKKIIRSWQKILNLISKLLDVPVSLIMKVEPPNIKVYVSSNSENNPYKLGDSDHLSGLYCERVMQTRSMLIVPNALDDPEWKDNPDVRLNMISYMGLPLLWPDGYNFGTICVLDNKTNSYNEYYKELLVEFQSIVMDQLKLIFQNLELEEKEKKIKNLEKYLSVCSSCKNIKDENENWVPMEEFFSKNIDSLFSHGMCPVCSERLYGDILKKKKI